MVDIPFNNQINNSVTGYSYKGNIEKINPTQESISKSLVNNYNIYNNNVNISKFNNSSKNVMSNNDNRKKLYSFSSEDMTATFNSLHSQTNNINNSYQPNIEGGLINDTFNKGSTNEILNTYNNIYSSMP